MSKITLGVLTQKILKKKNMIYICTYLCLLIQIWLIKLISRSNFEKYIYK